jgi:hypothetical protein
MEEERRWCEGSIEEAGNSCRGADWGSEIFRKIAHFFQLITKGSQHSPLWVPLSLVGGGGGGGGGERLYLLSKTHGRACKRGMDGGV